MSISNLADILTTDEKISLDLRALYIKHGYEAFKTSRFEEYEFYAANRAFLPGGEIVSFTDAGGKLMALRPDVTLSIVKSTNDDNKLKKLYYKENVYRNVEASLREQTQIGLECIGNINAGQAGEVVMLAKRSLDLIAGNTQLHISHMGFLGGFLKSENISASRRAEILKCLNEKNISGLKIVCEDAGFSGEFCGMLIRLASLCGTFGEIKSELERICINDDTKEALRELEEIDGILKNLGIDKGVYIDFSVVNDITYYNGIIFKGFIEGVPTAVLSGGRYDELLRSFNRRDSAIGFAVYLGFAISGKIGTADKMLGIALPKGRLGSAAYEIIKRAGLECPDMEDADNSRKLVFEDAERKVRYFWVKPSDVAIYVERGVADIGVVGKDTLLETDSDVFELLDLALGECRVCVAAKAGFSLDSHNSTLRVATKFPNIARGHFAKHGRDIDTIKLQGSIELAPLLGLSDVIVDIVETGKTLEENNMEVIEEITNISARLIANKASYRFNRGRIDNLCKTLEVIDK